jgi:hypothetical protein
MVTVFALIAHVIGQELRERTKPLAQHPDLVPHRKARPAGLCAQAGALNYNIF